MITSGVLIKTVALNFYDNINNYKIGIDNKDWFYIRYLTIYIL